MDDVMLRLKTATANEHKATERSALARAMLHGTMTSAEYAAQLSSYVTVHEALEAAAFRRSDVAYVIGPPKKGARLRADLAALGVRQPAPYASGSAVARFVDFLESASDAELVGVIYVFEGSALGAAILHPTHAKSLGLSDRETTYYRGEGPKTMEHWRAFGDRVRTVLRDEDAAASAERAARATFLAIQEIFAEIRPEASVVPDRGRAAPRGAQEPMSAAHGR